MGNGFVPQSKRSRAMVCLLPLALVSFNCINKPLDPVGPTWDTQMTAPLSVRSYTVAQLVARDPNLFLNAPAATQFVESSPVAGHISDTAYIGDTTGSGQGHTLVDSSSADDFTSIRIHVVVDNGIPVDVAVKLQFLDNQRRLLMNIPQTAGDSVTVPAPAVLGGIVQSPTHTERILDLSSTEIQQFNNSYSIVYFLQISSAGANLLALQGTQAINIRVWGEFTYQVNK